MLYYLLMDAYAFWCNLDRILGKQTLKSISEKAGLNYRTIKNQRSAVRLPGLSDAYMLASALGVSVECLLTGKERDSFPPRIQTIAIRCLSASEEDLALIERVLRIEAEKKPEGSEALA